MTAPLPTRSLVEHLKDPLTRAVLLVQQEALRSMRATLAELGLVELQAPLIGPVTDPGIRGSKQVSVDYYGTSYRLMTSAILYKQTALTAFDRIFLVAPNVRLEPPETATTGRHLVEFHQVDVEVAGASRDDVMTIAETIVTRAVSDVREHCLDELAALGRQDLPVPPAFETMTHAEAVRTAACLDVDQAGDTELSWPAEEALSRTLSAPTFVTDYPRGSRGFYDRQDDDDPDLLRNFDLLLPGGYGEVISGGEREADRRRAIARMRETGENPAKYGWYLDALASGVPASAGFGLGLERFTRYLTGRAAVWQCSAFPKLPGILSP